MSKIDEYKQALKGIESWDEYLLEHSGLPGPRANLELMSAVAELGNEKQFLAYCAIPREEAPTNSPQVFIVCCGILGLGKLTCAGKIQYFETLRSFASDERWRVREAVAMALQLVGDANMSFLLEQMQAWQSGNLLEQRAVMAALCEPRLLKDKATAEKVLLILDEMTNSLSQVEHRKSDEFVVLKKGLSYGWSVAVAASPEMGKKLMEKWLTSKDKDVLAIMKENLKKNRLLVMDPMWVAEQQSKL